MSSKRKTESFSVSVHPLTRQYIENCIEYKRKPLDIKIMLSKRKTLLNICNDKRNHQWNQKNSEEVVK